MAKLRALRISQNGKPGTIFEAEGNRVKQLTDGKNPIAELVKDEKETKPAPKPSKKGGKKPKDAGQEAEEK